MASLIGQIAAVLAGGCLVAALARRAGLPSLAFPRAVAVAVVALLAILAVGQLRESWHGLDLQRAHNAHVDENAGRGACLQTGIDYRPLDWIAARIPPRERFYYLGPALPSNGIICIRFLMLPRIQVALGPEARYHVIWQKATPQVVAAYHRFGATVELYPGRGGYGVARFK